MDVTTEVTILLELLLFYSPLGIIAWYEELLESGALCEGERKMRVVEGIKEEVEWSGSEGSSTLRVLAIILDAIHADKTRW